MPIYLTQSSGGNLTPFNGAGPITDKETVLDYNNGAYQTFELGERYATALLYVFDTITPDSTFTLTEANDTTHDFTFVAGAVQNPNEISLTAPDEVTPLTTTELHTSMRNAINALDIFYAEATGDGVVVRQSIYGTEGNKSVSTTASGLSTTNFMNGGLFEFTAPINAKFGGPFRLTVYNTTNQPVRCSFTWTQYGGWIPSEQLEGDTAFNMDSWRAAIIDSTCIYPYWNLWGYNGYTATYNLD